MNVLALIILLLVSAQRLFELYISRRNVAKLKAAGGVEYGAAHYPFMVLLHAAWLIGLWILAWKTAPSIGLLAVFLALQGLRGWILASLGERWTTRVIVVPGESLVRKGPYRFFKHPNYILVALEIAILPLCFGLWLYAVIFTLLNAAMLAWRIKVENVALQTLSPAAGVS